MIRSACRHFLYQLNTSNHGTWLRGVALLALACIAAASASAATSVSQFGITWTFDRDYPTGQFANGDYWVVGPVKITNITPRTNGTMHGSMVNPGVNTSQGYDSRISRNTYSASSNVALSLPLTLQPGSSLLSSESHSTDQKIAQLKTVAVLTVLASPAPAGSFRPPYIGTDKTVRWNKSQLNYSKLRSLPAISGAPSLASVEAAFERPWIEQKTDWTGRYMHPSQNQPDYGREMAYALGNGLLSLQLNYSNAQKEKLLIRLVQYGIDIYGAAKAGARWSNDGGHNHGRKMPLLLAGAVLGDANILSYANGATHRIFQEDQQTWYVTQSDVGRPLYTADGRPRERYIQSDVGKPEWGEKHYSTPERDGRNWNAYYRTIVGSSIMGHVLTARLMGLESQWNWIALFAYVDRYWSIEKGSATGSANQIPTFVHKMWSAYRTASPSLSASPSTSTSSTGSTSTGSSTTSGTSSSGSSRLINVSVRSVSRGTASPLIVGFVVDGSGRSVLVRSVGPSLAQFGVTNTLPNPRIDVHTTVSGADKVVASNDNWAQAGVDTMRSAFTSTGAFSLESTSLDAGLTMKAAGAHTVHAVDTEGRTGVSLVEVYDLADDPQNRIVNLSARNHVGTGDQVLIAGFVISGNSPKRLLIRGVGPGLKAHGVASPLADPQIEVHQSGTSSTVVASNDDWAQGGTATLQAAFTATGAFSLSDTASKDAALIAELQPGIYTVLLSGKSGATGEGLIEIYEMP